MAIEQEAAPERVGAIRLPRARVVPLTATSTFLAGPAHDSTGRARRGASVTFT
ncbi:hypothetical protein [Streptomyces sp. NPDC002205]|uniref:hypothetical protein n=1 Tax=Streptomyces sp. NPDC002205 TaxID=3154411 RepID=UPI0033248D39